MSRWLLCEAAKAEAERTGIVHICAGRRDHVCSGPRSPYVWKAWMYDAKGERHEKDSDEPCCASCIGDEDYGSGDDSRCCCHHWSVEEMFGARGKGAGDAGGQ